MGIFVENVVHRDRVVWRILQRFLASTPHGSLLLVARSWPPSCELVSTVARACDADSMYEVVREGVNHACTCVHCGATVPVPHSPTWHTASLALLHSEYSSVGTAS